MNFQSKMKKYNITKEFLEREYLEKGRSYIDISKEIGCNDETIRQRLIEFGIKRRGCKIKISKLFLKDEYLKKMRTAKDISKDIGTTITTITKRLKELGIEIRKGNDIWGSRENNPLFNRGWNSFQLEFIKNNYENMTSIEMSKVIGKNPSSINHKLSQLKLNRSKDFFSRIHLGERNHFYGKSYTAKTKQIIGKKNSGKNPKLSKKLKQLFKEGKLTTFVKKGMTYDEQFGKEKSKRFNIEKKLE